MGAEISIVAACKAAAAAVELVALELAALEEDAADFTLLLDLLDTAEDLLEDFEEVEDLDDVEDLALLAEDFNENEELLLELGADDECEEDDAASL